MTPAEVVRRQYVASSAGDLAALRITLAPDVEWTEMAGFPLAGTYRTPEGVTSQVMEALGRDWEGWVAGRRLDAQRSWPMTDSRR